MPEAAEWLTAVAIGIGLAAATGFRVFLPLLIAGAAAHWGVLPLADGFQWLSTTGALIALATASVVGVAGNVEAANIRSLLLPAISCHISETYRLPCRSNPSAPG